MQLEEFDIVECMAEFIYHHFYGLSLQGIVQIMILLLLLWTALEYLFRQKLQKKSLWKICNGLLCVGALAAILAVTLFSRDSAAAEVCLTPFNSFVRAKIQPEIYRSMLMNVFLFFPLGLTLPNALPDKCRHRALTAILFSLFLSVSIEALQYYFCLGRAETDDVLCNTLGCAVGTISYLLESAAKKKNANETQKMLNRVKIWKP